MNSPRSNNDERSAETSAQTEEFVRLYAEHQHELLKFIFLLVPSYSAAEDILQETSVVLWRKFHEFQPGTDFFRWAAQVARYKVRDFRKQSFRDRHRFWTDDVIQSIAETRLADEDVVIQQRALLAACIRKLTVIDREVLRRCFGTKLTIKEVAQCWNRPVNTLYKALNRIRKALIECVEKAKLREGHGD